VLSIGKISAHKLNDLINAVYPQFFCDDVHFNGATYSFSLDASEAYSLTSRIVTVMCDDEGFYISGSSAFQPPVVYKLCDPDCFDKIMKFVEESVQVVNGRKAYHDEQERLRNCNDGRNRRPKVPTKNDDELSS